MAGNSERHKKGNGSGLIPIHPAKRQAEVISDPSTRHYPPQAPLPKRKSRVRFNYSDPKVADEVAETFLAVRQDYLRTVTALWPELPEDKARRLAERLRQSSVITEAVQKKLAFFGLDEQESKKHFIQEMHRWLRFGNKDERTTAARILSRAYVVEKVAFDRPEALPIEGFDEGVKRMLGGAEKQEPEEAVEEKKELVQ